MNLNFMPPFGFDMFNLGADDLEIVSVDVTGDGSTLDATFRPDDEEKWLVFALGEKNSSAGTSDTNTPDMVANLFDGTDYIALGDTVTCVTGSDAIYTQVLFEPKFPLMITRDQYIICRVGGATKVAAAKVRTFNALVMKIADK